MFTIALIDGDAVRRSQLELALVSVGGYPVKSFSSSCFTDNAFDDDCSIVLCHSSLFPLTGAKNIATYYYISDVEQLQSKVQSIPKQLRLVYCQNRIPAFAEQVRQTVFNRA